MQQLLILLFAFCSIATNGQHLLTEQQKIDHLIGFVASLKGAVFIRNGIEHSPQAHILLEPYSGCFSLIGSLK